jgi:hypothetical protein
MHPSNRKLRSAFGPIQEPSPSKRGSDLLIERDTDGAILLRQEWGAWPSGRRPLAGIRARS